MKSKRSRSRARRRTIPKKVHELGDRELSAARKQVEAAHANTSKEALVKKFGNVREYVDEYGCERWEIKLNSQRQLDEFDEMDRPRLRDQAESGRDAHARIPDVVLRTRDGRVFPVAEHHADAAVEKAERMGVQLHEPRYYGRPTKRYLATPDGLLRIK